MGLCVTVLNRKSQNIVCNLPVFSHQSQLFWHNLTKWIGVDLMTRLQHTPVHGHHRRQQYVTQALMGHLLH